MKDRKKMSFIDYLEVIIKWRRPIIRNILIITVIAIIISLVLTPKFTATATILPPNPEQSAMLGLLAGALPGGLASISGMSSFLPGFATPSDLYAAIMKSGTIRGAIIQKYDLKKEFKCKRMSDTYDRLEEITQISVTPEGIIKVSVTYKNKQLATDIANSYFEELDKFNTETAMTLGKKFRIFVENRLAENIDSLAKAEEDLRNFQEKNRTVALDVEIQAAIQTIAQLKSQIIALEVQKGAWSASGRSDNPFLSNIERELQALRRQLAKIESGSKIQEKQGFGAGFSVPFTNLPLVSLEYARLLRDVKVQEAIYELLTQQYEQAKIMELKDTPTIQMLDQAKPPDRRSFPRRSVIVVLAFLAAIAVNILAVFTIEYINQEKKNEAGNISRFYRIYVIIKNDLKNLLRKIKR
jgi:tyrosine-protein kinase Etk/Wzc